jgi:hypothetical protein
MILHCGIAGHPKSMLDAFRRGAWVLLPCGSILETDWKPGLHARDLTTGQEAA